MPSPCPLAPVYWLVKMCTTSFWWITPGPSGQHKDGRTTTLAATPAKSQHSSVPAHVVDWVCLYLVAQHTNSHPLHTTPQASAQPSSTTPKSLTSYPDLSITSEIQDILCQGMSKRKYMKERRREKKSKGKAL